MVRTTATSSRRSTPGPSSHHWTLLLVVISGLFLTAGSQPAAASVTAAAGTGPIHSATSSWYESNPTYVDPVDDTSSWLFSSPEAQSMDSGLLAEAGDSLAGEPSVFSFLVVRHGHLVYERYYHGSGPDRSNNVHSASKSILQALIDIAISRGHIRGWSDRVSKYLPEYFAGASAAKRRITLRDLMTMSSGLRWTEDVSEYRIERERNWVRAILAAPLRHAPGTRFLYSTGNTHVASAVLQRATGMKTSRFARLYLFEPLGIAAEHWGRDPRGVDSGGYNVYLTARELAKFGLLYLRHGLWDDRRIVPVAAVRRAARVVWRVDRSFNYSTGWWQRRLSGHDMFFCWGWGGQFAYVIPDLDIVVVITENTADGHDTIEVDSGSLLQRYIIPSVTDRSSGSLRATVRR